MRVKQSFAASDKLTFGFDIGIASVGWCVLGERYIVDLGVRCFDKAETDTRGESLNLARRTARLMRRRLRRRAWRLTKLARQLKHECLIADVNVLKRQPTKGFKTPNLWKLRAEALDRSLSAEEWARVIYHLCKHRGFHWISRAEKKAAASDKSGEGGKVTIGLAGMRRLMDEKNYRTVAEMVISEFPDAQRNKQGDYSKALERELLAGEMKTLFQHQRDLGNPYANERLETIILGSSNKKSGLFWAQKPALAGDDLLKMLGYCTFEKGEYRAPKASFTAERHVWLTKLVNLKIVVDGVTRRLQPEEVKAVVSLPYEYNSALKYRQLHSALVKKGSLPESFVFSGLTSKKDKDPLDQTLVAIPAWQAIRGTLEKAGLKIEWQSLSEAAIGGNPELLDQIAKVLSVYKDGDEVEQELRKLSLPGGEEMIETLSEISFDKFHNLSLKALRKIVPHMETGLRYDEACEKAGYHHSQLFKAGEGQHKYLPPFYSGRDKDGRMVFDDKEDIPRNPVVLRSLNQARKVLNALVSRYGSPYAVHIEMARDLSRPMDERNKIKKAQEEFRDKNEKAKADFSAEYDMLAKNREFEKFLLYREQQGKCAYSLKPLDLDRVLREPDSKYAEVDHILPYRRSYDNSKNNKVLVLVKENQDKGNRTPYEYLTSFAGGESGERWRNFAAYVESNKSYRLAKRTRLLRKNFGKDESREFMERNLNDTRYICRFFKNYVEKYLKFSGDSKRCVVVSGGLTSLLRARWGLPTSKKKREESDRHHAMDAAVIAACGHLVVQRTSTMLNAEGWTHKPDMGGYVNVETEEFLTTKEFVRKDEIYKLMPRPWKNFREELLLRLNTDDPALLKSEAERYGYPPEALKNLRPLFVSRAPQRRKGGALHEATLRSPKLVATGKSYTRVDIRKLKLVHLDSIVGASDPRNAGLIEVLRSRLQTHGDDGKKAFAAPIFKPTSDGKIAPPIRTVKLKTTQKTGALVGNAIADLGDMLHVDVFKKGARYFFVPIYGIPANKRINPIAPPEAAEFLFSLTKNDFLEVTLGAETTRGYFVMFESDGRLTLRAHDQPQPDKNYFRKSVSSATKLIKFNVDVLGGIYPSPSEKHHGLA